MAVHLAKGTRDFLPADMLARRQVVHTVQQVFERFGFEPLDTPVFERIETLTGKYGDEGEKLIYKILKRGEGGVRGEVDQALRYDLTVPLARVLAMNPDIRLPFRRYHIAKVWRADRPAKGRFREFFQCDVDIAGSSSPLADAECLAVLHTALNELGFKGFTIRLNDRRILADLAAAAGAKDSQSEKSFLVALDKLDKIGRAGVDGELAERGFAADAIETAWEALTPQADDAATLAYLGDKLGNRGKEGVAYLGQVRDAAIALGVDPARLTVDPTLARGLDYYTGPVFEATVDEPKVGSIAGGGRYDGLVGVFSKQDIPCVGVSLGLERIVTVMAELGMLPEAGPVAEVLVTVFSDDQLGDSLAAANALRAAGVRTEVYAGSPKLKNQFKHANARGYTWLVVVGPDEAAEGVVTLKNLRTGEQQRIAAAQAGARILESR
ncbi:MAG: histidine--tRNA ligase [Deltaproteobacteria bacterium]|nr:MAG: histidine--tRNA ligase [Deltaproteobacteria bacterium]